MGMQTKTREERTGKDIAFAVAILVLSPEGVPLVYDESKPLPIFWKLPGGKGKDTDRHAKDAAQRELEEETGVCVPVDDLVPLFSENRGNHNFTLFGVKVSKGLNELGLKKRGNEGERVGVFKCDQLDKMMDFFPPHLKMLVAGKENLKNLK